MDQKIGYVLSAVENILNLQIAGIFSLVSTEMIQVRTLGYNHTEDWCS